MMRILASVLLSATALVVLSGVAGAQTPADAPVSLPEAIIGAFTETCLPADAPDYDATVEAAIAAGWIDVEPEADPELRALMTIIERGIDLGGAEARLALFQREAAYRVAYLIVTFLPGESGGTVGCDLYDTGATEPLPTALLSAAFGAEPTEATDDGLVHIERWAPPAGTPAFTELTSNFVAESSPAVGIIGFSGTGLIARWRPAAALP